MSDFSYLDNKENIIKDNELKLLYPIIAKKLRESHDKTDYDNFNDAPFGEVDIFFPTDF